MAAVHPQRHAHTSLCAYEGRVSRHDLMAHPEVVLSGVFRQVGDAHRVLLAAAHAVALGGASALAGRHIAAGLASCLGQAALPALHALQHRSLPR